MLCCFLTWTTSYFQSWQAATCGRGYRHHLLASVQSKGQISLSAIDKEQPSFGFRLKFLCRAVAVEGCQQWQLQTPPETSLGLRGLWWFVLHLGGNRVSVWAAGSWAEPSPDGTALLSVTPRLISFSASLHCCSVPDFCSRVPFFEERKSSALSSKYKKNLFKCF